MKFTAIGGVPLLMALAACSSSNGQVGSPAGTTRVTNDGSADEARSHVDATSALDLRGEAAPSCAGDWQGVPVGMACYPGVGACITKGLVVCENPTTASCSVSPGAPDDSFHASAAPNGSWDWNCNNSVDRKYPLAACETFQSGSCPANGWSPQPGESGDCGQMLVQRACAAVGGSCQSTGASTIVSEGCK